MKHQWAMTMKIPPKPIDYEDDLWIDEAQCRLEAIPTRWFYSDEETKQSHAVYYSALASLDELTEAHRKRVVMNWVKYVALKESAANGQSFVAFAKVCIEMSDDIMDLPETYLMEMDKHQRGECPRCQAGKPHHTHN